MPRAVTGFLTRVEAKEIGRKKTRSRNLPIAELHRLGPRAVRNMNPDAKNFNIPPTGSDSPDLYVLGEAPGADEDAHGTQFTGKSGKRLRRHVYAGLETRWNNVVATRPPKNRTPHEHEIEAFRPQLQEDIARSKPKAILAVGAIAAGWCLPHLSKKARQAKLLRGRCFPVCIKGHATWVFPVLHPAYVLRLEEEGGRDDGIPGKEWARYFERDIRQACRLAPDLEPPSVPDLSPEGYKRGIKIFMPGSEQKLLRALRQLGTGPLTLDFETKGKDGRPYGGDPKVLAVGIGNGSESLSFPLDHPRSQWPKRFRTKLLTALRRVLEAAERVIAQNAPFEIEWLCHLYGSEMARPTIWEDTMAQGYILDHRQGGHSLDFLGQLNLAVPVKSLSQVSAKAGMLEAEPVEDMLLYNGLDVKFTHELWHVQGAILRSHKLQEAYEMQVRRAPTVALAQRRGLCIDTDQVRDIQADYGKLIRRAQEGLLSTPEARLFREKTGKTLNPNSSDACIELFRDVLKRPEGEKEGGKYSAAESILAQMEDCGIARKILDLRSLVKLKGTYVDKFLPGAKDSYIWDDGKVHCSFSVTRTATGRLASDSPNNQNWPKRDKRQKQIRRIVVPRKGNVLLSADYGQIEARIIGILSKDQVFCQALWDDYDIHLEWAERIAKRHPKAMRAARCDDIKAFRSFVKNAVVFPLFYGATHQRVMKDCHLSEKAAIRITDEFWDMFSGVKRWQEELIAFYRKHGYVECLTGRRRYGPLSRNMIVNTPVQGLASDIVVNAMDRLSEYAIEENMPWLQAVLNIHDDLTFDIPRKKLEEAAIIIAEMMVTPPFDWISVPILVEMETGENWYEMEEVGTFSSEDLIAA